MSTPHAARFAVVVLLVLGACGAPGAGDPGGEVATDAAIDPNPVPDPATAADPEPAGLPPALQRAVATSRAHLGHHHGAQPSDLALTTAVEDDQHQIHARFRQRHGGVPVFGGESIVHLAQGAVTAVTDSLVAGLAVDPTPAITADDARTRASAATRCAHCRSAPPVTDLWILRHAGRDHLVWRVQVRLLDGVAAPSLPVVFVDAHDGAIVWQYDNLQTGSGPSLYSGPQTFTTTPAAGQFYLEDVVRRLGTFDLRASTNRFIDPDDVWDSPHQRAGIDAHLGARTTYDYLKTVHGRDGLDGLGGPSATTAVDGTRVISSYVHYGTNYNNAFWDGSRMTYGDGDGVRFSPLVSLDIAGHEMMHGVTQYTADLIYQGESGALNESYADVFGALVERHARGDSDAVWKVGDECYTPATPGDAARHLDAPHLASDKGYTADDDPDHYSERYLGSADGGGVHINSGIGNKTFYLLAQGGSHHRGGSMVGIGADKAAAIWYRALTSYLTASTSFAQAAQATALAAEALYGAGSPEVLAVETAWTLTGVRDLQPPTTAITAPADGATVTGAVTVTATATDDRAVTRVELYVDDLRVGTDGSAPYRFVWSSGQVANGSHTLVTRAFDAVGLTGTSPAITVTTANDQTAPVVALTAPASGAIVAGLIELAATATDDVAVTQVDFYVDGVLAGATTTAPYRAWWFTRDGADGAHTVSARAVDAAGNPGTSAPVTVIVANTVPDTTAPTTAITAPAAGATIRGTVDVTATAADDTRVDRVELWVDGTLYATDRVAPYRFSWNTLTGFDGVHTLATRAFDAADHRGTSPVVMITVDNLAPTAAITAPAAGALVRGDVTVAADVVDAGRIEAVELYVDNVQVATATAAPYRLLWRTTTSGDGSRRLRVRALDAAGNRADSAAVLVTVDNRAPISVLSWPVSGAVVGGSVTVIAAASDLQGVRQVELYVDGGLIGVETTAPYTFVWQSASWPNGPHTLTSRAVDLAGNASTSAAVTVTAANGITTAAHDPGLRAPRCSAYSSGCDTGTLIDGRASKGPERNAPNTLHGACGDGPAGSYHLDESIDRLRVYTSDGLPLAAGKPVLIEATIWNRTGLLESDALDLFYTTDPASPSWRYLTTLVPGGGNGVRVLSASLTAPSSASLAVRGILRRRLLGSGSPAACTGGAYNDHDDLVLAVAP